MRYFLMFIYLFVISTFLLAQIDSFNIASYARPDLQRKTTRLNPTFTFDSRTGNRELLGASQGFYFDLGGDFSKTIFKNSPTTQLSSNLYSLVNISYSKNNSGLSNINPSSSNFRFSPRVLFNRKLKKFKNGKDFLEFGFVGGINASILNVNRQGEIPRLRNVADLDLGIPIYMGNGRIELVNDAWHAVTIFELLNENNLLRKNIEDQDIHNLANELSIIKNLRNTDSRLEAINEYKVLCKYFISNNIVYERDYHFFAILNDAYKNESFVSRFSGREWKFGIIPSLNFKSLIEGTFSGNFDYYNFFFSNNNYFLPFENYYPSNYVNSSLINESLLFDRKNSFLGRVGLIGTLSYVNYVVSSIDWQKDFYLQLSVGTRLAQNLNSVNNTYAYPKTELVANVSTSYSIQYIPNARSYYRMRFNLQYNFIRSLDKDYPLSIQNDLLSITANLRYLKYISPKLSWFIDGAINFNSRHFINTGFTNLNRIQIGVDYRFF